MSNLPVISVVIPAYNREDVIERAVYSLLAQKCEVLFEVIVVNDGSTDQTERVVKQIDNEKLLLVNILNSGASAARFHGVKCARGDFIAFLDSDDVAAPHYLQSLYNALKRQPECTLAYARVGELDGSWHREQSLPNTLPNGVLLDPLVSLLEHGCFTISMNLMVRKVDAVKAMQGRQHILASNDFDFCLRVAMLGPFVFVDSITIFIDRRSDGIGQRFGYRQVSFAVLVAREAVGLSERKDSLTKRTLSKRVSLLWPTAFAQCIAHKKWFFAMRIFMTGLIWGKLSDAKRLYWAVDHYVINRLK